jgi:hypothetical protein
MNAGWVADILFGFIKVRGYTGFTLDIIREKSVN